MSIDEARDAAWEKCKKEREPYEGSDDWTVGESCTYRGFFNLGYEAALPTIDPEAIRRECADRAEKWLTELHGEVPDPALPWSKKLMRMRALQVSTLRAAILGAEPEKKDTPLLAAPAPEDGILYLTLVGKSGKIYSYDAERGWEEKK